MTFPSGESRAEVLGLGGVSSGSGAPSSKMLAGTPLAASCAARPLDAAAFVAALPKTAKTLVVLDRTKEPGCLAEPLFLDVLAAVHEFDGPAPRVPPTHRLALE